MTGKKRFTKIKHRFTVVGKTPENQFDCAGGDSVYTDIATKQIVVVDSSDHKHRFMREGTTIYEEEE